MPVKCHPYAKVQQPLARATASWTVPDLCKAYSWPTGATGNGTIAIVELGGGWKASDIAEYFKFAGQPEPHITDVSVDGTKNEPGQSDADVEVALDIEVAGASFFAATGRAATIRVYWSQQIETAVAAAAADGCAVCSISWGADEAEWGETEAHAMQAAAVAANAAGMVVFAASGDNDSSDGGPNRANVDLPAGCPNVVGCGGTSKPAKGAEVVWNNNPGLATGEGTGGGYSRLFSMPTWQLENDAPPGPVGRGRLVPDLAANADPQTGYQIFVQDQGQVIGGTSAVAPLMAGLFAALGQKLGDIGPDIWAHQNAFIDVTQGNNGRWHARIGPDACSGVGVPIGTRMAGLFA